MLIIWVLNYQNLFIDRCLAYDCHEWLYSRLYNLHLILLFIHLYIEHIRTAHSGSESVTRAVIHLLPIVSLESFIHIIVNVQTHHSIITFRISR